MMQRQKHGYPQMPEKFHHRIESTLANLPPYPALQLRSRAVVALALLCTFLLAVAAIAAHHLGVLDVLRGFARPPVFLESVDNLVQQDVASLTLAETRLSVREVLTDGRRLHILYAITDLDGTPIHSEADLVGQLGEAQVVTQAAYRDGWVGMVRELGLNGISIPFGSYHFQSENPGEMLYWVEADISNLELGESFEVGLPAHLNEDGWYYTPDELRFTVSMPKENALKALSIEADPMRFGDHTVTITSVYQSPLALYMEAEVSPDEGLSARRLRQIQRAWDLATVRTPEGTVVAETAGNRRYTYAGDPLEPLPQSLTLQSEDGTLKVTAFIKEEL